jgi:hypothetical protein
VKGTTAALALAVALIGTAVTAGAMAASLGPQDATHAGYARDGGMTGWQDDHDRDADGTEEWCDAMMGDHDHEETAGR